MKNILLIGDSILVGSNQTSGYGTIVRDMLKDKANVYIPLDNARYTMYTLRNLAGWIDAMPREKMDIVQWNNLEWDIGEFYQDGPLTPLPFYVDTLRRIYQRIRLFFPNAEIIYATGTKVIDEKSPVDPNFERHNSVIEIYNQAAAELMAELNVRVNDLYKISEAFTATISVVNEAVEKVLYIFSILLCFTELGSTSRRKNGSAGVNEAFFANNAVSRSFAEE